MQSSAQLPAQCQLHSLQLHSAGSQVMWMVIPHVRALWLAHVPVICMLLLPRHHSSFMPSSAGTLWVPWDPISPDPVQTTSIICPGYRLITGKDWNGHWQDTLFRHNHGDATSFLRQSPHANFCSQTCCIAKNVWFFLNRHAFCHRYKLIICLFILYIRFSVMQIAMDWVWIQL